MSDPGTKPDASVCEIAYPKSWKGGEMSEAGRIVRIDPGAGIAGGEVVIECADFDTRNLRSCRALFDGTRAWLVGASPRRVLAIVPELTRSGEVGVTLESGGARASAPGSLIVGTKL